MKPLNHSRIRPPTTLLAVILLCCTLAALTLDGCKTKEQSAYVATQSIVTSVDIARGVANDFHKDGKMSDADFERARSAYIKYQAAVRVLRDVVIAAKESPDAPGIELASKAVSASAADLIALVNTLTQGTK